MIVALLQRPADWLLILALCGFTLCATAWVGMYFRLKREVPDHIPITSALLKLPVGLRRSRFDAQRNLLRLIQIHFERHRLDLWSTVQIAGLTMLAVAFIDQAL